MDVLRLKSFEEFEIDVQANLTNVVNVDDRLLLTRGKKFYFPLKLMLYCILHYDLILMSEDDRVSADIWNMLTDVCLDYKHNPYLREVELKRDYIIDMCPDFLIFDRILLIDKVHKEIYAKDIKAIFVHQNENKDLNYPIILDIDKNGCTERVGIYILPFFVSINSNLDAYNLASTIVHLTSAENLRPLKDKFDLFQIHNYDEELDDVGDIDY